MDVFYTGGHGGPPLLENQPPLNRGVFLLLPPIGETFFLLPPSLGGCFFIPPCQGGVGGVGFIMPAVRAASLVRARTIPERMA